MKPNPQKRTKAFVILIIALVLLVAIVLSVIPGSPLHRLSGPLSFVTKPIEKFISRSGADIKNYFGAIKDSDELRKENISLREEITKLEKEIRELEEAGRRYEELKDAFHIKDKFSDYTIIGASVLAKDRGSWYDLFRVDVGISDGVKVDNKTYYAIVDSSMNLAGRVYSTDYATGKILPIINEQSVVNAKADFPGGPLMQVRGDVILKEKNQCIVEKISDASLLKIGDEIITSGLGEVFPAGIPIGRIVEINQDHTDDYAILDVYADYKLLKDVFIMKKNDVKITDDDSVVSESENE